MYLSVKMKSVFEKYLSNTPKYANQIQIQIQIFHLVVFQIQIQIQVQIFAYLNTNTNTYLTPALITTDHFWPNFRLQRRICVRDIVTDGRWRVSKFKTLTYCF